MANGQPTMLLLQNKIDLSTFCYHFSFVPCVVFPLAKNYFLLELFNKFGLKMKAFFYSPTPLIYAVHLYHMVFAQILTGITSKLHEWRCERSQIRYAKQHYLLLIYFLCVTPNFLTYTVTVNHPRFHLL